MGAIVGGVALKYDLLWVTQFQRRGLGSAKRGLDGTIAISTLGNPNNAVQQIHIFKFNWVTRAQLEGMRNVYRAGLPFTIVTGTGGHTLTGCIPLFYEEDGFTPEPIVKSDFWSYDAVAGYPTDRFNGQFKVYVAL